MTGDGVRVGVKVGSWPWLGGRFSSRRADFLPYWLSPTQLRTRIIGVPASIDGDLHDCEVRRVSPVRSHLTCTDSPFP